MYAVYTKYVKYKMRNVKYVCIINSIYYKLIFVDLSIYYIIFLPPKVI